MGKIYDVKIFDGKTGQILYVTTMLTKSGIIAGKRTVVEARRKGFDIPEECIMMPGKFDQNWYIQKKE